MILLVRWFGLFLLKMIKKNKKKYRKKKGQNMSSIIEQTRGKNITFSELKENLSAIRDARHDIVVNTKDLVSHVPGFLRTPEIGDVLTSEGVGLPPRDWELTPHALRQWCHKFNVPAKYMSKLVGHESFAYPELAKEVMNTTNRVEERDVMLRGLIDPNGLDYYCRAIVSPSYSIIENFDILAAVFEGFKAVREEHGIDFEPGPASVSDTQMRARINIPQLHVVAEELLRNYTSPFTGNRGIDNPIVFMGIEIRNSEVGAGAFSLVPSVIIQVCDNGMTLTEDIYRKVHLGASLDSGVVSQRTLRATTELITSETIDKVVEIAHPDFIQAKVDELRGLKKPVGVQVVSEYLKTAFDDDVAMGIFNDFVMGTDLSAFGVAQAITSYSQKDYVPNDVAQSLDDSAIEHAKALV